MVVFFFVFLCTDKAPVARICQKLDVLAATVDHEGPCSELAFSKMLMWLKGCMCGWRQQDTHSRTVGSGQAWALAGCPRLPCAICFEDLFVPPKAGSGPSDVQRRSEADEHSTNHHQLISMSNVLSSSREQTPLSLTKHCSPEGKQHKEKQGAKAAIQNFSNLNSLSLIFGVSKLASPRATAGRGILFMG